MREILQYNLSKYNRGYTIIIMKPKTYTLKLIFNGLTFTKRGSDIAKMILSVKPEVLYTEIYVVMGKKGDTIERRLNLIQGRKLFTNDDFLEIFINNLLLEQ
jgi:hypothetical protein